MAKKVSQLPILENLSGFAEFLASYEGVSYKVRLDSIVGLFNKESIGLDQVDNTPDNMKPVSQPQQLALNQKADKSQIEDLGRLIEDRSPKLHTHAVSDVSGLPEALATKANSVHRHQMSEIEGLNDAFGNLNRQYSDIMLTVIPGFRGEVNVLTERVNRIVIPTSWNISAITGLQQALNDKASAIHNHTVNQISGLADMLATIEVKAGQIPVKTSEW